MYGYIYKTTNLVNGKIYVGKKEKNVFVPTYYGSGLLLRQDLKTYGIEKFKIEILQWCRTLESLNAAEKRWIKKLKAQNREIGYNISGGGDGGNTLQNLSEDKKQERFKKIANKLKNRKILINKTTKEIKHIRLEEVDSYFKTNNWEFFHPKIIVTDYTKKLMSEKAKKRKPNTKGKIRICLPDGSNQKYVTKKEFEDIFQKEDFIRIYYLSKKYKNKLQNKAQKYYENKKGTILMRKDKNEKALFVKINEVDKYLKEGYMKVNNNKGRKHSLETISKMHHPHRKMKDTSNITYAKTKWIYTYNQKDFYGIVKIWETLREEGYNISQKGIDNIVNNKKTTCKKYPSLIGKITRRLKS